MRGIFAIDMPSLTVCLLLAVPTFVSFLKEVESPYEVHDYIRAYLGDTPEAKEFAKQFLERRAKQKASQQRQQQQQQVKVALLSLGTVGACKVSTPAGFINSLLHILRVQTIKQLSGFLPQDQVYLIVEANC